MSLYPVLQIVFTALWALPIDFNSPCYISNERDVSSFTLDKPYNCVESWGLFFDKIRALCVQSENAALVTLEGLKRRCLEKPGCVVGGDTKIERPYINHLLSGEDGEGISCSVTSTISCVPAEGPLPLQPVPNADPVVAPIIPMIPNADPMIPELLPPPPPLIIAEPVVATPIETPVLPDVQIRDLTLDPRYYTCCEGINRNGSRVWVKVHECHFPLPGFATAEDCVRGTIPMQPR